jgi:general stress protein 26
MRDIKNLSGPEGIEKIKDLALDVKVCMFCTKASELPFETRPMSTQDVDDKGNIWFLSCDDSSKIDDIKQDDAVQLVYSNLGAATFLTVYGRADVFKDKKKAEELWSPIAKAWVKGGADDPNLVIIRVRPETGYYWNNKHGKVVAMFKIAASLVSDKTMDDGIEGRLKV